MKKYFNIPFIILILILSSCRKDKEFVVKQEKKISKEELESLKNLETRLLILRNKQTFNTLNKYLQAKENHLKYSENPIKDKIFLSEYYLYLSFTTLKKTLKHNSLLKSYRYSREILKSISDNYAQAMKKNIQDYEIIPKLKIKPKYLKPYLYSLLFLRENENTLPLFKEDIEACIDKYKKITRQKTILPEIILYYKLPLIAGGNKEKALNMLKNLNSEQESFDYFIKTLFFEKKTPEAYKNPSQINYRNEFKNYFFKKMIEINFKNKK